MKKGYGIFTAICIIGILIMSTGSAMAVSNWLSGGGNVTVVVGSNSAGLYTASHASTDATYALGSSEGMASGDFVTFTLTGGAVFTGGTPLTATVLTTPGATTSSTGALVMMTGSGAAGSTEAKFRATQTITTPQGIKFNCGSAVFNLSGLVSGSSVDYLLSISNAAGTVITSNASYQAGTIAVYPFSALPLVRVVNTVKTATLDVMSVPAYTRFENNLLYGGTETNGLNISGPKDLAIVFGAATTIPATPLSAKKIVVTLSGVFAGISKITCVSFTGCDATGSTTGGTTGQFLINAAKTEAYATYIGTWDNVTPILMAPNFYVDGTTVQVVRQFTAKVETLADANYLANTWMAPTLNYKLARNGTFFSANSLGPLNNIKISDLSGNVPTGGAKVLISAWDAAGTRLAEASGVTDILVQNHSTVTISGAGFAARFVGTPMKYEVAIQSTTATLSNIKKDPVTGGITSTVYVPTASGGGAL